jgi:hypothetical protein
MVDSPTLTKNVHIEITATTNETMILVKNQSIRYIRLHFVACIENLNCKFQIIKTYLKTCGYTQVLGTRETLLADSILTLIFF